MRIIRLTSARFAVRSGGHNPNAKWASMGQDGILIDLHLLKTLTLSQDREIMSVGPGNRWSDVYQYLNETGTSVAGARVPEVGVGGQLLGGKIVPFCFVMRISLNLDRGAFLFSKHKRPRLR